MPNSAPEVFQGYFRKRRHFFSKKLKFWTFGDCKSNNSFWKAFWRKISAFSVFENFQVLFGNKTSLFPKNPNFWTSSKHMTNSKVRDVFEKKTCGINCFWKFQNIFLNDLSIFPKKVQILKVFRILGQWILLVHILDENSPVLCFWIFSRMFFEYSISFAEKKTSFERFENSCAKIQLEMQSIKDLPKLAIFEKSSFFSKKSKFWTFWECISKKKLLKSILKESIHV